MIKNQNSDRCYLLLGEDQWTKSQFVCEIKNKILSLGNEMMNYFELKDKEITLSKIADSIETLPFFADQKLIYIKDSGFLKAGKKEDTDKFETLIKTLPEHVVLIIDEKETDKRSKLYKTIHSLYTVIVFDYPGEDKVFEMLRKQAAVLQLNIDSHVLTYFLRNMPEDIAYIMGEFNKLCDYAGTHKVTQSVIDAVCIFSLEKRIFELVKKVAQRNTKEAFQIYHTLIESKESPIGILVLIARQYRVMLQVKYLLKNKIPSKEIASKLKLPFFALKDLAEQVRLYSFKDLQDILIKCLETDKDIKSGKMDGIKRVEVLIMECLHTN